MHIVMVGCGNMGSAILKGWLAQGVNHADITVIKPHHIEEFKKTTGVNAYSHYDEVKETLPPHLIIFAVKPAMMPEILPTYQWHKKILSYVTIAAGTPISFYQRLLNIDPASNAMIVRAMPNLPVEIGQGVTGLMTNADQSCSLASEIEALFSKLGTAVWVKDEAQLNALTAVSGSGSAYVFYFIECLQKAAQQLGFDEATALSLAK